MKLGLHLIICKVAIASLANDAFASFDFAKVIKQIKASMFLNEMLKRGFYLGHRNNLRQL
jgi:hypothetical protein